MAVLRGVAAVLAGYLVSQGINGLLVYYWYAGERSAPAATIIATTVALFLLIGVLTGPSLRGWVVPRVAMQFGGWPRSWRW